MSDPGNIQPVQGRKVVLTDGLLTTLAGRKDVQDAFPAFRRVATKIAASKKKRCCRARFARQMSTTLNELKQSIDGWPSEAKQKFKTMLGADRVVVNYRRTGGSVSKSSI